MTQEAEHEAENSPILIDRVDALMTYLAPIRLDTFAAAQSHDSFTRSVSLRTPLTLTSIGTVILEKFVQGSAFTVFKNRDFRADALNVVI
jgi:hypothetical protein